MSFHEAPRNRNNLLSFKENISLIVQMQIKILVSLLEYLKGRNFHGRLVQNLQVSRN